MQFLTWFIKCDIYINLDFPVVMCCCFQFGYTPTDLFLTYLSTCSFLLSFLFTCAVLIQAKREAECYTCMIISAAVVRVSTKRWSQELPLCCRNGRNSRQTVASRQSDTRTSSFKNVIHQNLCFLLMFSSWLVMYVWVKMVNVWECA